MIILGHCNSYIYSYVLLYTTCYIIVNLGKKGNKSPDSLVDYF